MLNNLLVVFNGLFVNNNLGLVVVIVSVVVTIVVGIVLILGPVGLDVLLVVVVVVIVVVLLLFLGTVVVLVLEHVEEELLKLFGSCDLEVAMVKPAVKSTKKMV